MTSLPLMEQQNKYYLKFDNLEDIYNLYSESINDEFNDL